MQIAPAVEVAQVDDLDESDGPLSPAARQRRVRANRKKLAQEQGLKAVWLTAMERQILETTLHLFHSLKLAPKWSTALADVLQKLRPGATWPSRAEHVEKLASQAEVEQLRRQVEQLQRDNSEVYAERGKAMDAVEVLQARLSRAGLVSDYRRQPGE